jgi:hypothetical protein
VGSVERLILINNYIEYKRIMNKLITSLIRRRKQWHF